MDRVKELIFKKPVIFLLISCGYILLIAVLKWWIHPKLDTLWFAIGAVIGIYFLDGAEFAIRLALVPPTQTVFADFGEVGVYQWAGIVMRLGIVRTQGEPFATIGAALDPNAIMPIFGEADADPMDFRAVFKAQGKLRPRMVGGIGCADNA